MPENSDSATTEAREPKRWVAYCHRDLMRDPLEARAYLRREDSRIARQDTIELHESGVVPPDGFYVFDADALALEPKL